MEFSPRLLHHKSIKLLTCHDWDRRRNTSIVRAQKISCSSHYDEGKLLSSLLWHCRFGHLNFDNLCLLNKNGVTGLPTIPRKLKPCDSFILGKHNK